MCKNDSRIFRCSEFGWPIRIASGSCPYAEEIPKDKSCGDLDLCGTKQVKEKIMTFQIDDSEESERAQMHTCSAQLPCE